MLMLNSRAQVGAFLSYLLLKRLHLRDYNRISFALINRMSLEICFCWNFGAFLCTPPEHNHGKISSALSFECSIPNRIVCTLSIIETPSENVPATIVSLSRFPSPIVSAHLHSQVSFCHSFNTKSGALTTALIKMHKPSMMTAVSAMPMYVSLLGNCGKPLTSSSIMSSPTPWLPERIKESKTWGCLVCDSQKTSCFTPCTQVTSTSNSTNKNICLTKLFPILLEVVTQPDGPKRFPAKFHSSRTSQSVLLTKSFPNLREVRKAAVGVSQNGFNL